MKKLIYILVGVLAIVLISPEIGLSQPGLPSAPDQAPLGGLGLLAAVGGAYAWKKLRNTKA
jgi:hypothetical protein